MGSSFLHYNLQKKIGQGGMGVVYLANDTRLNRRVALKFLPKEISKDPSKHDRFRIEAQAAAGLNHPNIAQVHAIEEANGELCIVLEYVEGQELKDLVESNTLDLKRKITIATDIADGLRAAHQKGIIHRDIKSRNIMVDSSNRVKIMDFGLARLEGSDQPNNSDSTAGTTAYMSPEQLQGKDADARSDIWSYGVVLYELFTGKLPFRGMHEAAIMYSITEEDPLPIEPGDNGFPEYIRQIINRCLEKKPDDRYQEISQVLVQIDKSTDRGVKEVNSGKTPLILGAIICTILLTLFIFWWDNEYNLMGNVPQKKFMAVLPIENISDDSELDLFSVGLTETLSYRLSDLEQFQDQYWVTPASEIRSKNVKSALQAREQFGVNLAISSRIQIIQDSIRLGIELIDTENIVRIDHVVVTVSSQNLQKLENESVQALLNMLQIEVKPAILETISLGETENPDAYKHYLNGRANLREPANLEMLNAAIQHFDNALDIDSEYALAYAGKGEALWRQFVITQNIELVERAMNALTTAQSINEKLTTVQFLKGLIENGQGNYEAAIQHFQNALSLDPEYTRAHRLMARAHYNLGETEKALEIYEQIIDQKPEYWIGYDDLAIHHLDESNYDLAIKNFKKAIELTSKNSSLYNNLGASYLYKSETDSARMMFERAMIIEKNLHSAANLANIYFRNGRYTDAANNYEFVLENEEFRDRYDIWANYAAAVDWSESMEGEDELYRTAIEKAEQQLNINPNDAVLLSSIAVFYSDLNNREQALNYLDRSMGLNSENHVFIVNVISTYENLGMREEALIWVQADIISEIEWLPDLQSLIEDPEYIILKEELLRQDK